MRNWISMVFLPTLLFTACLTTMNDEVVIPPKPEDDKAYFPIYKKNTAHHEVIHNFETKYTIHATQLVSDFREAMADRYQKIYNEPQPLLAEASNKAGYFVSMYIADDDSEGLDEESVWNIQLKRGNDLFKPTLVKKLRPKDQWQPFFPSINPWTEEYLILFDESPTPGANEKELLKTVDSELIISSAGGRVVLDW